MDQDLKDLVDFLRNERRAAAQNLHQWLFAIIALCSAILGYTATKVLESSIPHVKVFGSLAVITFGVLIMISLWRLLRRFKNDYLAAWATDKGVRGLNVTEEEIRARQAPDRYKPDRVLETVYYLFCAGLIFTLLAVLPLQSFFRLLLSCNE